VSAPRIMFQGVASSEGIEVSDYEAPHTGEGALSTLMGEYWEFTDADVSAEITLDNAAAVNCLAMFFSGLAGATVEVSSSSDGGVYESITSQVIESDGTLMIYFDEPVTSNYFRIDFIKLAEGTTRIINMMLGRYTEFERCIMKSHAPAPYQRNSQFFNPVSGEGQFLSRSQVAEGVSTSVSMDMITAPWARTDFQAIVENALSNAYYFAWNPLEYPDEVIFGWTDDDVGISYTGDANLMSASWDIKGFSYDILERL